MKAELNELLANNILFQTIDLSKSMAFGILESKFTACIKCKQLLNRINRWRQDNKGSIALVIDNKKGPILMIHYLKKCNECNLKYHYGRIYSDENVTFIANTKYVQISSSTFIAAEILERQNYWCFEKGNNPGSIVGDLKQQFAAEFTKLKESLVNQALGRNKFDMDEMITESNVNNAWYLWHILKYINLITKKDLIDIKASNKKETSNIDINRFNLNGSNLSNYKKRKSEDLENEPPFKKQKQKTKNKKKKSEKKNEKEKKKKNESSMRTKDFFYCLWQKYHNELLLYDGEWINYYPTKVINTKIEMLKGHSVIVGDVDAKIKFDKCSMPESDYQHHLKNHFYVIKNNELNINLIKYLCCNNPPIRGNQHVKSKLVCEQCKNVLLAKGLPLDKINGYIMYRSDKSKLKDDDKKVKLCGCPSPNAAWLFSWYFP